MFKLLQKKLRPKTFVNLELWLVYTFAQHEIKQSRQPGKYRVKQMLFLEQEDVSKQQTMQISEIKIFKESQNINHIGLKNIL